MSNDVPAEDDCIGIEEQAANLILELWAEVERQARHVKELREKIDAERSCACSFDAPGDVCAAHSPALTRALAEVERLHKAHEAACRGGEWLLAEKVSLRARMSGEISDLRAENERLIRELNKARVEVERLTGKLKLVVDALDDTISKYHEVGDQNDRLDAENERLREAMTDMLSGWRYIRETYGDLAGIGWDRVEQKARETLEAKP